MERIPRQHDSVDLPAALAEYGHLAAQLPGASSRTAEQLRTRLAELDVIIDDHVAALAQYHSVVDS